MNFFLFGGDTFYPRQGIENYHGAYHTLEAAKDAGAKLRFDWFQVLTLKDGELALVFKSE